MGERSLYVAQWVQLQLSQKQVSTKLQHEAVQDQCQQGRQDQDDLADEARHQPRKKDQIEGLWPWEEIETDNG